MTKLDAHAPEDYTPTLSEVQEEFLVLIAEYGTTDMAAAAAVGRSRWSPIEWKKDPAFLARYKAAKKIGLEPLVREAERRAMNGSDRLLEFLLCNYAPERFSNKHKVELAGELGIAERLARARKRTVTPDAAQPEDGSDLVG